jgi:bacillithiol system protein YtxJ
MMTWIPLEDFVQIDEYLKSKVSFIVFKHSTRCSISSMAMQRFEKNFDIQSIPVLYLDILSFRSISDKLAQRFHVLHQSPQLLFIKDEICLYHASHNGINLQDIKAVL